MKTRNNRQNVVNAASKKTCYPLSCLLISITDQLKSLRREQQTQKVTQLIHHARPLKNYIMEWQLSYKFICTIQETSIIIAIQPKCTEKKK